MVENAACVGSGSLRALSCTSKMIREACLPFLFHSVYIPVYDILLRKPPPPVAWPFIRNITFSGHWTMPVSGYPIRDELNCLYQMPALRTITVKQYDDYVPISPRALYMILSTPQLRTLCLDTPANQWAILNLQIPPTASLTCLHIFAPTYREHRSSPGVEHLIGLVAASLHLILEELEVPFEFVPLTILSSVEWPRLRKLSFSGGKTDPTHTTASHLASILSRAPMLSTLTLDLALPHTMDTQPMFRQGSITGSPWPELRELTISHPDPADELFAHLPESLTTLRLNCWPHHYFFRLSFERASMSRYGWGSSVLRASEALAILRRSTLPRLRVLELEYEEDSEDMALLQQIPALFPGLTMLTIYWYRRSSTAEVPVDAIARALAPLSDISVLRLYLEFPEIPIMFGHNRSAGGIAVGSYRRSINSAADVFFGTLGSSLKTVFLLDRDLFGNQWALYREAERDHGEHGQRRAVRVVESRRGVPRELL
ncbi:hypothetical protein C2E23DRAFT_846525 [Lenzites betulinus]|nr:hypothetical protein C2E23DRAFT_846525 [Lenzites betulinus]